MLENKEQDRGNNREVEVEWGSRKAMDTSDSKIYHEIILVAEKDVILVVCNRLSKIMHFVATTEETLVEGLARLFRDNV